ncbi:MAG: Mrp/NBP35 family ATP-binding protein [Epsilonproteobacteria bacterium]|nr:Mrp/NBP35 family ATP-binding protein [Campylobacterota bacterium]
MTKKEVLTKLKEIQYPKLDKNIIALKTVEHVEISGDTLTVVLSIVNEEAYAEVEEKIEKLLGDFFKDIKITPKMQKPKKSLNYGNTQTPNNRAPYAKRVIAVTSGKGGVGKSTVSANLSVALAQKGYKVGLLDADIYGPNIPRMLQVDAEKMQWNDDNKIIPSENFGIKIMSVGLTTPSSDTPLVWRSSVAVSALIQFLEDVAWGELDFLVIDMPPGTGDVQLTMAQELPITAAVLVTTPQSVATDDVSRAIMMFKETKVPMGGLVENMSYFIAPDTGNRYDIFGNGGGEKLAQKYNIPFLGDIPLDMQIREFSDEGKPPVAMGDENLKTYYQNIINNLITQLNL